MVACNRKQLRRQDLAAFLHTPHIPATVVRLEIRAPPAEARGQVSPACGTSHAPLARVDLRSLPTETTRRYCIGQDCEGPLVERSTTWLDECERDAEQHHEPDECASY